MASPDTAADEGIIDRFADWLSDTIGRPSAFLVAVAVVLGWAVAGPFTGFGHGWQLAINSVTTIVTFLMVFLLANASNRITENQDRMLAGIYDEERRVEQEEHLIRSLLERLDARVQPLVSRLDQQDERLATELAQITQAIDSLGKRPNG